MKKITAFLATTAICISIVPSGFAQEEGHPLEASIQKCSELSGREEARCIRNNLQVRRHDLRQQANVDRQKFNTERQTNLARRKIQWENIRENLRNSCRDVFLSSGIDDAVSRAILDECRENNRKLQAASKDERREFQRSMENRHREMIKGQQSVRRDFKRSAREQVKERQKAFIRNSSERPRFERVYPGLEEDELVTGEVKEENEEESTE